jgi:hypothetical protein
MRASWASGSYLRRRDFVKSAGVIATGFGSVKSAAGGVPTPGTVRDCLWLWGHPAGSHNGDYGLKGKSIITPVEAAYYMSIPNVIMIRYGNKPDLAILSQYSLPFRALREVVWSIPGAADPASRSEKEAVLKLAADTPNMNGIMMDDFFTSDVDILKGKKPGLAAGLSPEDLAEIQKQLKGAGDDRVRVPSPGERKLDLWAVLYTYQLVDEVVPYLKQCDRIALWTWKAEDLAQLEANFEKTEKLAPAAKKVLGCYMWDYGTSNPMPVEAMRHQCEVGHRWLTQGRIDGMIFLASCICDIGIETVEWTRKWIQRVGDAKLS